MNFDASKEDVPFVQCAVCEQGITGGRWFARIRCGERMVALCCPLCTEVFEKNPKPYVRRIEMMMLHPPK
jgi:predicted nucleic acid-binding Zn ribbon protein